MDWLEVSITTSKFGVEIISGILYELGITGLEIVDSEELKDLISSGNGHWDYVDDSLMNLPVIPPIIKVYLSDNVYGHEQLSSIKSYLLNLNELELPVDVGSLSIGISNVSDEDWANNWKKYFKPFAVGEKIVIKPTWEEYENSDNRLVLEIDPGAAFGTGTHETTRLCLEMLEKYVDTSDRVLDIGCGSGILSIASLLLGADFVFANDIDHNAVDITRSNLKINGFSDDKYIVSSANILEEFNCSIKFNVVVANIIADVIINISPLVFNLLTIDGIFICSGIIASRIYDVKNTLLENGFQVICEHLLKDWAVIVSRKIS